MFHSGAVAGLAVLQSSEELNIDFRMPHETNACSKVVRDVMKSSCPHRDASSGAKIALLRRSAVHRSWGDQCQKRDTLFPNFGDTGQISKAELRSNTYLRARRGGTRFEMIWFTQTVGCKRHLGKDGLPQIRERAAFRQAHIDGQVAHA